MSEQSREKIAHMLFPRATAFQINAFTFKERLKNRTEFFTSRAELLSLKNHTLQSRHDIEEMLRKILEIATRESTPKTPRSIKLLRSLLEEVSHQESLNEQAAKLHRMLDECIKKLFTPTYQNIVFAMYPILNTILTAQKALFSTRDAGEKVGYYCYPLEHLIQDLKNAISEQRDAPNLLAKIRLEHLKIS